MHFLILTDQVFPLVTSPIAYNKAAASLSKYHSVMPC